MQVGRAGQAGRVVDQAVVGAPERFGGGSAAVGLGEGVAGLVKAGYVVASNLFQHNPLVRLMENFPSDVILTVRPFVQLLTAMAKGMFPVKVLSVMVAGPVRKVSSLNDHAYAPTAIPALKSFCPVIVLFVTRTLA